MQKIFGLIGNPLQHSYSKEYFEKKFGDENLNKCSYELFEIKSIGELKKIMADRPEIIGLNVTIPFKETIIPLLNSLNPLAKKIGAVNTIKVDPNGALTGFNTDFEGFKNSLLLLLSDYKINKALVLGSGGSSKAIQFALFKLHIDYHVISRKPDDSQYNYDQLFSNPGLIAESQLIVNTTPVGMYPEIDQVLNLNFDAISSNHLVYDLIYNPTKTKLLKLSESQGAKTKNGMEMLVLQAEEAWKIWSDPDL